MQRIELKMMHTLHFSIGNMTCWFFSVYRSEKLTLRPLSTDVSLYYIKFCFFRISTWIKKNGYVFSSIECLKKVPFITSFVCYKALT